MTDLFLRSLFTWRSAIASQYGPESSITRHVLLTLSLHMNERGESCFPSMNLLADETGLSRRAVVQHLQVAFAAGWVGKRDMRKPNTQGWKRVEYFALIPAKVEQKFHAEQDGALGAPASGAEERGEQRAPARRSASGAKRGAPDGADVVHEVHPSSSGSTSPTLQGKQGPQAAPVGNPTRSSKSPSAKAADAYVTAMVSRYGVEPAMNARLRGQFSQLVERVGADRAAVVAEYFVRNDSEFYRRIKHSVGVLLKDCERLDIELKQAERAGPDQAKGRRCCFGRGTPTQCEVTTGLTRVGPNTLICEGHLNEHYRTMHERRVPA